MSDEHLTKWVLDNNQRLGAISEGRLVVTAGAGTGKTRVLIHRFAHLVLSGQATVEQVLAITFTEKAAAQMATRVAELFETENRYDLRKKLIDAPISTIHAFCYKLLKENSIEAGIDPSFDMLSDFEKDRMAATAVKNALEKIQHQDRDGYEKFSRTVRTAGRFGADIKKAVQDIYDSLKIGRVPIDKAFEIPSPHERYNELIVLLQYAIEQYRVAAAERKMTITMEGNEALIVELLQALQEPDIENIARACSSFKLKMTVAKDLKGPGGSVNDLAKELAHTAAESYAVDMRTRDLLCELLRNFDELFRLAKKDKSLLDFSDLEQYTLDLLESRKDLAAAIQDRFKFVLVDEFQDVNPLQAKIIELISREDNLFIVGDHKQSIYGFRQADVRVFQDEVLSDKGQRISLVNNYRTKKTILDFVNLYFESVWKDLPKEIAYEALIPGKDDQKIVSETPDIDLLTTFAKPEQDTREAEAGSLALRISQMTARENADRVDFSDITVLFRSKTQVAAFLAEFIHRRIPFCEHKGRGLFDRAEIVDLQHFLEIVANPYDELALVAVLRSPFVGIDDESLFYLCREGKKQHEGLWGACKIASTIDRLDKEYASRVDGFLSQYKTLSADRPFLSVDRFVQAIFERTGYRKWTLTQPDAARKIGNIEQIIHHTLSFCAPFGASPGGLAEALADFRNLAIKAQDAPSGKPENAITLMTVHAAKGLESQVVFLADCNHKESPNNDPIDYHTEEGVGFKVYLPDFTSVETTTFVALKERKKQEALQEDLRLFYVALTRAEKRLVLSVAFRPDVKNRILTYGWAKVLLKFFGLEPKKYDDWPDMLEPGNDVRIKLTKAQELTEPGNNTPAEPPVIDRQAVLEHYDSLPETAPSPDRARYLYTVSEIMTFAECPRRFYLQYRLRLPMEFLPVTLPDDTPTELNPGADQSPRIDSIQFGNAVHELFARVDIKDSKWQKSAKMICDDYELDAGATADALSALETFWANPEIVEIEEESKLIYELPFLWKASHCMLRGKIDLLIRNKENGWLIDFKTNRIGKTSLEKISERYRLQMILYSLAHQALYGALPIRTSLYFTQADRFFDIKVNAGAVEFAHKAIERCIKADGTEHYPATLSKCPGCDLKSLCVPDVPDQNDQE